METRRVQISGGSTFIVSIPKRWATRNGLKAGFLLNIEEDRNGNLILSTKTISQKDSSTGEIQLNGKESSEAVLRRLVGAYINGVPNIRVISKENLKPDISRTIRDFTRLVMGVEIVDEKRDSVTLQDLIDPKDFSIRTGIKRMAFISEGMLNDSLKGLTHMDDDIMNDVIMRDIEVDRICWLIQKEYNLLSADPMLVEKTGVDSQEAVHYMMASRHIERVADHGVSIASNLLNADLNSSGKTASKIKTLGIEAKKHFLDSVSSLLSRDLELAEDVIERSKVQREEQESILKEVFTLQTDTAVRLAYVINSIDRINAYAGDISKTTINMLSVKVN